MSGGEPSSIKRLAPCATVSLPPYGQVKAALLFLMFFGGECRTMYQALYRKYRPQVFSDVVGQEHITKTLMNEIKTGRHSHAYLFTGSRGTGKTTCAKIFAKAVNCEHPVNGDPCNECEICRGIDDGSVLDVVEIDAASNNGVDNIRDIRDEANFTPVNGKYRVYIIDEVHMLSTGAFNALLKTLEEPPEHVKFILATTEVHKLPATILSRCQRFDFRRISPEEIAARVSYVADQEGLELSPEAAGLIARLADGALRDALSILDQCMGHGRVIDEDVVNEVVGLAGRAHLFSLADCLIRRDSAQALDLINTLHNRSVDMERLCSELINHFRNLMVCRAVRDPKNLIVCSGEELQDYISQARRCPMDDILNILNVLGDTLSYIRKGLNRRVEMEMAVIRLCAGETLPEMPSAPQETQHKPNISVINLAQTDTTMEQAVRSAPIDIPLDENDIPAPPPAPLPIDEVPPVVEEPAEEPVSAPAEDESPEPEQHAPEMPPAPDAPVKERPQERRAPFTPQESSGMKDGIISTDVWNAIIRETVSHDKALIGTMNSAAAEKRGSALLISTDNILLKRFVTVDVHRQTIINAVLAVTGERLKPMIVDEDDILSVPFPAAEPPAEEPVPEEPAQVDEPAPAEQTPAPAEEPAAAILDAIVDDEPEAAEPAVPTAEPAAPEAPAEEPVNEQANEPEEADALESFLDRARGLGLNIIIEE